MKPRAWVSFLVLFISITLAAVAEQVIFPLSYFRIEPPCLLSVVIYYAMRREAAWGWTAAVWAGIIVEGSAAFAPGLGIAFHVLTFLLCRIFLRPQLPENAFSTGVCAAAFVPLWTLLQYVSLNLWADMAIPFWWAMCRAIISIPLSAVFAPVIAFLIWRLDWISANVDLEAEESSHEWYTD